MQDLRLIGVTEDGTFLLLKDRAGTEFRVANDARLQAAARGHRARLGQLDVRLDSQLTPREIQSRVRAGESPVDVADAAGVPVDRVLRFAQTVLDERAHVAGRARRASVRRGAGEGGPATLEDAVDSALRSAGVSVDGLDVDAYRSDDGKWTVVTAWPEQGRPRRALWSFDASRTSVSPASEHARWLLGERGDPDAAEPPAAATARLAVVPRSFDEIAGSPRPEQPARHVDHDHELGSDDLDDEIAATDPDRGGRRAGANGSFTGRDTGPDGRATGPVPRIRQPGPASRATTRRSATAGGLSAEPPTQPVPPIVLDAHEGPAAPGRNGTPTQAAPRSGRRASVPPVTSRDDAQARPGRRTGPPTAEPDAEDQAGKPRRSTVPTWDEIMFGRRKRD